jgi:hypothetical protein
MWEPRIDDGRVVITISSEERLRFSVEDFLALTKAVDKDGTLQGITCTTYSTGSTISYRFSTTICAVG